jgi:hypothetical protein
LFKRQAVRCRVTRDGEIFLWYLCSKNAQPRNPSVLVSWIQAKLMTEL